MAANTLDDKLDFGAHLEVVVRTLLAPISGGRTENQDNYLLVDRLGNATFLKDEQPTHRRIDNWPEGHCRLAILDGMGGHSFGREATELAVEGLLALPPVDQVDALSDYLDRLHERLHSQMRSAGPQPGCTLTIVELPVDGPALLFHVGDSRLYEISTEHATFLTIDHVPATKFAMFGLIDENEWIRQAHQSSGFQISQAFILGNSLNAKDLFGDSLESKLFELHDDNLPAFLKGLGDRRPLALSPERSYLLASDGFWHLSQPLDFIAQWPALIGPRSPSESLDAQLDALFEALIARTRRESRLRGDNSTAILFRTR